MAVRQVFSCDWCGVDSPKPGFIGDGWKSHNDPYGDPEGGKVVLCATCFKAARDAWYHARHERSQPGAKRHS